jgi:hypothetical protein
MLGLINSYQRVRHLSACELIKRAFQKLLRPISLGVEEWQARRWSKNGKLDEELSEALKSSYGSNGGLKELLHGKRPALFTELDQKFFEVIAERFPSGVDQTFKESDKLCDHIFELLGSGQTPLGEQIDWHADFKSGKRWEPDLYYKRVRMDDLPGADILVPWWLSSFYHLMPLGKAYGLAQYIPRSAIRNPQSVERYATEFMVQVSDWIKKNPYPFGVNWASTTIVSIRLIHWIWGFYFFRQSPVIPDVFWWEYLKQLYLHARHIRQNMEWFPVRTNHYLCNLAALLYLGLFFPEFQEASAWKEFAHRELIAEIEHHVYSDGVVHEGSLNYHRFVTEIFLSMLLLGKQHGMEFPQAYVDRSEKGLEFILHHTRPDGTAPRVGDAAPITLQNFGQPDLIGDHRWLLAIGAVVFNRPDFKASAAEPPEALLWLLGREGFSAFEKISTQKSPCVYSVIARSFPKGGFHIIRNEKTYLLIRCGPLGMEGVQGHWHYDQLSFELWAEGEPILVDPGWYVYEADVRMLHHFKSTRAHNTVTIDKRNQIAHDLFVFPPLKRRVPKLLKWDVTPEEIFFQGEHLLYADLCDPVRHERTISFKAKDRNLEIRDRIEGNGIHDLEWNFHFAPKVIVDLHHGGLHLETQRFTSEVTFEGTKETRLTIEEDWLASSYGIRTKAAVMRRAWKGQLPYVTSAIFHF